jgi:hypothetical protein
LAVQGVFAGVADCQLVRRESAKVNQGLALFMCTLTDGAGHCDASSKAPKVDTFILLLAALS